MPPFFLSMLLWVGLPATIPDTPEPFTPPAFVEHREFFHARMKWWKGKRKR